MLVTYFPTELCRPYVDVGLPFVLFSIKCEGEMRSLEFPNRIKGEGKGGIVIWWANVLAPKYLGRKIISLKEDEEVKDASVTGLEQLWLVNPEEWFVLTGSVNLTALRLIVGDILLIWFDWWQSD